MSQAETPKPESLITPRGPFRWRRLTLHVVYLAVVAYCLGWWTTAETVSADEPLRIVPQFAWGTEGRTTPDGKFAASCNASVDAVHLIDTTGPNLIWSIPLADPADVSFSPDGRWMGACGKDVGVLLDLRSAKLTYFDQFRGKFIQFTRDSRKVVLVRRRFELTLVQPVRDEGLFLHDLAGKQQAVFPVAMEVPQRLDVMPDGKSIRVLGAHGNPYMRAVRMGTAELTVNLETGQSDEKRGPIERRWVLSPPDPTLAKLPQPPRDAPRQTPAEVYWDEATGIAVQFGTGMSGGASKSWDIRGGRFLATLGHNNIVNKIGGFLGPGVILSNSCDKQQCRVSLVDARSGVVSLTALDPSITSPAPGGQHFTARYIQKHGEAPWFGLFAVPPDKPLYQEKWSGIDRAVQAWSPDGKWLVRWPWGADKRPLLTIRAADGQAKEIALGDLPGATGKVNHSPAISYLAISGDSSRVAVGVADCVAVYDLASGARQAMLSDVPTGSLQFVGLDRLLTATGGRVQFWDLSAKKPVWTAETGKEVLQFDYVHGGPFVVCVHLFRSATLLHMKDGGVVRRTRRILTGDSSVALPWVQPRLVGDGSLALEMASESMQLQLVNSATGKVCVMFCALPADQWIVYTPDGLWEGSERVHAYVKFYNGLRPITPTEADAHRSRAKIEAAIRLAFAQG